MRPDFFVDMQVNVSPNSLVCPKCRNVKGRVLPYSEPPTVQHWFLRCGVCGHVWTLDKKPQALAARSGLIHKFRRSIT
jgi:uncharacterized Zn finger protein